MRSWWVVLCKNWCKKAAAAGSAEGVRERLVQDVTQMYCATCGILIESLDGGGLVIFTHMRICCDWAVPHRPPLSHTHRDKRKMPPTTAKRQQKKQAHSLIFCPDCGSLLDPPSGGEDHVVCGLCGGVVVAEGMRCTLLTPITIVVANFYLNSKQHSKQSKL